MDDHTLSQLRAGRLAGISRLSLSCGLTEFPPEIFDLAESLEILDLSGNRLSRLPDDLHRLHRLHTVFCSDNQFTELPPALGRCAQLSIVGFKANRISQVPAESLPAALRWLILTNNRIEQLPDALGERPLLQKLMLAGNRLRSLPTTLAGCSRLELLRIAANQLDHLPAWLFTLPRLAWLGFSGNPVVQAGEKDRTARNVPAIPWGDLTLEAVLGEGASGVIYRAQHRNASPSAVAVKVFKGEVTSDGLPQDEMAACMAAGTHPALIGASGRVTDHPAQRQALVMPLIDPSYRVLAGPPSLASCSRDVYDPALRFDAATALRLAGCIGSAVRQLHACGVTHGDLYAHNVLWAPDGAALLGDFGAASFTDGLGDEDGLALQRIEARAFGVLLDELVSRIDPSSGDSELVEKLATARDACLQDSPALRPSFEDLASMLSG